MATRTWALGRWWLAVLACAASSGCGGGSSGSTSVPPGGSPPGNQTPSSNADFFDPSLPEGTLSFEVPPVAVDVIDDITPLGNLNPSGNHTTPSDHMYLNFPLDYGTAVDVFAPSGGKVLRLYVKDHAGVPDYSIVVGVTRSSSYCVNHVALDPVLAVGDTVTAGQRIGHNVVPGGVDFGMLHSDLTLPYEHPERFLDTTVHGDSPLKFFSEPLKSQLYALVHRDGSDKDGTFFYDQPGKLVGNWFHESIPTGDYVDSLKYSSKELAFVYDVHHPSKIVVSVGGTILPAAHAYYVTSSNPIAPENVTPATGKVAYALDNNAAMIVQMLDDDTIQVEARESTDTDMEFSADAQIYVR